MSHNLFSSPDDHLSLSPLPPLPQAGELGPEICATIQLYLGILDELAPAEQAIVQEHLVYCLNCAAVQKQVQFTNHLLADLPASAPSDRVDQAVMAAIATRPNGQAARLLRIQSEQPQDKLPTIPPRSRNVRARFARKQWLVAAASLALVAVLLFAVLASFHLMGSAPPTSAFLPANLSWSGYVLYHRETRLDSQGEQYRVDTYHDLGTNRIHVETVMPDTLDVVVVGYDHKMLGLDMMHHVAQWGADIWSVDESMFDLNQLRQDMAAKRATYLNKDTFHGQPVYRIRCRNGLVLLLNMSYQPVNVLRGAIGPGTGEPLYDSLQLMPSSHVPNTMWDMSIPNGFHMGTLPIKP